MIATTLKQSKRLIELGLSPKTADMWWLYITAQGKHILCTYEEPDPFYLNRMQELDIKGGAAVPAWSLNALINLLPHIRSYNDHDMIDGGMFIYRNKDGMFSVNYNHAGFHRSKVNKPTSTIIDAVFNAVVWALENKYINV